MNNVPYVYLPGSLRIVKTYQCSNCVPLYPEFYYIELPSLVLTMEIKSSSHPFFSAPHYQTPKKFWETPTLLKTWSFEGTVENTVGQSLRCCRAWPQSWEKDRDPECPDQAEQYHNVIALTAGRAQTLGILWKDLARNGPHLETTQQADTPPKGPFLLFARAWASCYRTFLQQALSMTSLPCHSLLPSPPP